MAEKRFIPSTDIEVVCTKTTLSRKAEPGVYPVKRRITTTYPVLKTLVVFDRHDEEIKDKMFTCRFCRSQVKYRAYCEFIPRFILKPKKFAMIIGVSIILFLLFPICKALGFEAVGEEVHLLGFMSLAGALGLIFGMIWLAIDGLRAGSRREDKYKYRLKILERNHPKKDLSRARGYATEDSWTPEELVLKNRMDRKAK